MSSKREKNRIEVKDPDRLAKHVSCIFNPVVLGVLSVFLLSVFTAEHFVNAILLALMLCMIGFSIPYATFLLLYKKNNLFVHIFTRSERLNPVLFSTLIISIVICLGLVLIFKASSELIMFFITALELSLLNYILNYYLKVSGHVIAISSFLTMLWIVKGTALLILVPTAGLVAWSRIKLGLHTFREIVVGFLLGSIITLLTFAIGAIKVL